MSLYAGVDLHSNNSYIGIVDEENTVRFKKKCTNDLPVILGCLEPSRLSRNKRDPFHPFGIPLETAEYAEETLKRLRPDSQKTGIRPHLHRLTAI